MLYVKNEKLMKKKYVAPCSEIIVTYMESYLCGASKGEYDLGNQNHEQGGIGSDQGGGTIPDVNSSKGYTFGDEELP